MEEKNKINFLAYIPELDAMRAIAAFFVIISHCTNVFLNQKIPYGGIGVGFFFVLSGFLITRILLFEKHIMVRPNFQLLKIFYIRRALRIFPAYYLFLFLNYLLKTPGIIDHPFYYIFYGSNILFFKSASFAGSLSPTWSLAVEEQFYITWPIIFCFINLKWFLRITGSLIILSILIRFGFIYYCKKEKIDTALEATLLPSNIMFLLSGAILAYLTFANTKFLLKFSNKYYLLISLCFLLFISLWKNNFLLYFLYQIVLCFSSLLIINLLYNRSSGGKRIRLLLNPILQFCGKISYGMYVYHTVSVTLLTCVLGTFLKDLLAYSNNYASLIITSISTIIIASLSWFLMEKPINRVKKFFYY